MRRILTLAAAVTTMSLVGCSESTSFLDSGLAEGLTVLDAHEGSLSLAYRADSDVIYLEAERGLVAPEMYQEESEDGAVVYEVDARFSNAEGLFFFARRGGDDWADPTWGDDFDAQADHVPTGSNGHLYWLATESTGSMRSDIESQIGSDLTDALRPEIDAILGSAKSAGPVYDQELLKATAHFAGDGADGLGQLSGAGLDENGDALYGDDLGGPDEADVNMSAGYYYISIHDASTLVIAKHSATRLYRWGGSGWLFAEDSCNHGRCPFIDGMSQKCLLQYWEPSSDYKPSWTLQSCARSNGYDAFSNGSGHNCHDDTRLQLASFVYGWTTTGGNSWCGDGDDDADISSWPGDMSGSPECDSGADRGYNHHDWCDYNYSDGYQCPSSWQGTNDGCDCNCTFPDGSEADPDCAVY